jgi:hypothetical protein
VCTCHARHHHCGESSGQAPALRTLCLRSSACRRCSHCTRGSNTRCPYSCHVPVCAPLHKRMRGLRPTLDCRNRLQSTDAAPSEFLGHVWLPVCWPLLSGHGALNTRCMFAQYLREAPLVSGMRVRCRVGWLDPRGGATARCKLCMYVCMYGHGMRETCLVWVNIYIYIYIYMYVCIYTHIYICEYTAFQHFWLHNGMYTFIYMRAATFDKSRRTIRGVQWLWPPCIAHQWCLSALCSTMILCVRYVLCWACSVPRFYVHSVCYLTNFRALCSVMITSVTDESAYNLCAWFVLVKYLLSDIHEFAQRSVFLADAMHLVRVIQWLCAHSLCYFDDFAYLVFLAKLGLASDLSETWKLGAPITEDAPAVGWEYIRVYVCIHMHV